MASKFTKFLNLSGAEKRFFIKAVMLLPLFWLVLRCCGLVKLQAWLDRKYPAMPREVNQREIVVMGKLVNAAARFFFPPATCLTRSVLLRWLLHRRGIITDLRIGVLWAEGKLDAHAWVEYQGMPINDVADIGKRFVPFDKPVSPESFS